MRVIMANKLFTGYLGGVERYIYSLSSELARLGVDVVVCASGKAACFEADGFRVRNVPSLADLRAFIRRGADVVHAHLPRKLFSFEALRSAHGAGIRTVFTPHAFYPGGSPLKKMGKLAVDRTFTRYSLRTCDVVVNLTPQDQADSFRNGLPRAK